MAANVIVDAGFLVALLSSRDANHDWATCEASVTEAFRLLGPAGARGLRALLERRAATCTFPAGTEVAPLLKLMAKYTTMSFEDACLVRMTETMADPVVLTIGAELRTYRRLGRKTVPCVTPGQTAGVRESDQKGKTDLDDILQDVTRIFRD